MTESLARLWRQGLFTGNRPDVPYFVRCDEHTMTMDDIRNGRLIVQVGFAPLRPEEGLAPHPCSSVRHGSPWCPTGVTCGSKSASVSFR